MIFYVLLYIGFAFLGLVFLAYALPAMRMAHVLSWRRAGSLVGLTLALMGLAAAITFGIYFVAWISQDAAERTTMIFGAFAMALSIVTILLISLLQGIILCKVVDDRAPLKLFIRSGAIACGLPVLFLAPTIFGKLTSLYSRIPYTVSYVVIVSFLVGWHALLGKGLFNWAKSERREWRIRNWLCIHCESKVSAKDELCPECGKPCRAW